MSRQHSFLAFDCGATSGRAVLATFSGGAFDMKEVYRFPSGIIQLGGKYYWDVLAIYQHFCNCLADLGRQGIVPESIGIDTWGVDFGFVAEDGSLLGNPRAYRDPYTEGIPEKVFQTVPREELYGATGIQIMNFNSIFQLYAQTQEGFAPLKYAQHILFMPDLLSYMLTGKKVCEYTIASTSGMMDQSSRQFNKELLEKLGVRTDVLLPIVQPGEVIGTLQNFTNEGGIEGTTRFLKNITGMWLLEQCRKIWKASGKDYSYAQLVEMAVSEKDFSGRLDPDDPRFANPENMVEAITSVIGPASDGQIVSCIYHSLADKYAKVLESLQGFAPYKIDKLHIIGGGSANDLMSQWTADAIGLPVVAGPTEATAIGNVMIQAKAAGLVKDRWDMRKMIAKAFAVKTFYPAK